MVQTENPRPFLLVFRNLRVSGMGILCVIGGLNHCAAGGIFPARPE
jgi:hypothetical protein